jgi:heme/copper-type cytochrome/quinol oxidase subunit 4
MTIADSMCKDGLPLGVQRIIMRDCSFVQVLLNLLLLLHIANTCVTTVCLC